MDNLFTKAANLRDASIEPVAFALPSANTTNATSTWVKIYDSTVSLSVLNTANNTVQYVTGTIEAEMKVPALSTSQLPSGATATVIIETSTNQTTIDATLMNEVMTGLTTNGAAAFQRRCRLPSNVAMYVRGRVLTGANTGDCSATSATFSILF